MYKLYRLRDLFGGTLQALECKKTFVTEFNWMTEPFTNENLSPFDVLTNMLLRAPARTEQGDRLAQIESPELQLEGSLKYAQVLWQVDEETSQFLENLAVSVNGPLCWPTFSGEISKRISERTAQSRDLPPIEFHFIDVRIAKVFVLYWSILLVLWSGMCGLYMRIKKSSTSVNSSSDNQRAQQSASHFSLVDGLPSLGHRTNFVEMAQNIYQSANYCMQDDLGLSFMSSPLHTVTQVLSQWPGYELEIGWARGSLDQILGQGVAILKFLPQSQ